MTVALLTSAVLAGPFATSGRAAPPNCSIPGRITPHPPPDPPPPPEIRFPRWYSIDVPTFPSGPQVIADYAVDPLAANNLYVTNGEVVLRSTDAGCHWSLSYPSTSGPEGVVSTGRITEIEVGAPGVVYLPIQQLEPVPKPVIMVSTDYGASWSDATGPLAGSVVGLLEDFDAHHGNRMSAAMLVDIQYAEPGAVSIDSGQVLFMTETQGRTWEPRVVQGGETVVSGPVISVTIGSIDTQFESITMNPFRPNEVWLFGEGGAALYNGSPQLVSADIGGVDLLDVSLDGQGILAFPRSAPVGYHSVDGGGTFGEIQMGFQVDSVDISLGLPTVAAVGAYGRVFYQVQAPGDPRPTQLIDISPPDGRAISDLQVAVPGSIDVPAVYGRTADTLEVTYRPEGEPVDVTEVLANPPAVPIYSGNKLIPENVSLNLNRGASRTIPYHLELPAANTPLDVYFMIDISGSMQTAINGIRGAMQEIVSRLIESKIDVRFGVGAFRAYNDPPAYDRVRDIGPSGPELADALNSLRAGGGGLETQMAALLQSVTGEGDSVIPAGLNMHFREGSLRVAIEVTDEPISQGGQHPSYVEVAQELLAHDVRQVGIAVQDPPLLGDHNYEDPGPPADILQKVAEGSDAIAPATGVDCDGDGDLEIQPGGPVVCMVAPSATDDAALMADAIVNMLQALQDIQDLEVSVTHALDPDGDVRVLESIVPTVLPQVDLKEPSAHDFAVTVRCPYVAHRTVFPLRVAVTRRAGALAATSLTVVCKGPPKEEAVRVLSAFVPVAIVPPPPPRPPDPVPEPNPNPNPNPQQNPQAQAGFAAQEQQQPQVAFAAQQGPEAAVEEALTDEYMMSRHDEQSRIPPVGFIFAAGGVTSIYAYAMATRQRSRTAPARNRRRR